MYTTDDFLRDVKRVAQIPVLGHSMSEPESEAWTDEGILLTGTQELRTRLVPEVMALREDFFRYTKTVAITGPNQRIRIPERAVGNKLKSVLWVHGTEESPLDLLDAESGTDGMTGFSLDGAFIVLRGTLLSTGSVRLVFFARHGELVATSECGRVTGAFPGTGSAGDELTFSTTAIDGSGTWYSNHNSTQETFDVIHGGSPYDYVTLSTVMNHDGGPTSLTADDGWDNTVEVGDYVFLEGETAFIQLPEDLAPVLVQRVAVKVMEELGDEAALARASRELASMERAVGILTSPRVDKSPRKVFSKRLFGF